MSEEIKNPYVAVSSKHDRGYNVLFRYLLGGKIHFASVCSCIKKPTAQHIAKLLNENYKKEA